MTDKEDKKAGGPISQEKAIKIAEAQGGSRDDIEAVADEKEPAPETPEVSQQKPTNEMKVVIVMKADRILLGVQAPDCDPVYTTLKGDLAKALKKVPGLVAEAKQKWETTPQNPKANLPEPPPTQVSSQRAAETPKVQPTMF